MPVVGERAIVLGASMGGLLAARALSDFYRTVTVVERDVLVDEPVTRRGVPQGTQAHALLPRCSEILDELFEGFLCDLVAAGVPAWDDGDLSKIYLSVGGHRLVRSGAVADKLSMHFPSRPLLEWNVRRRVASLPNVTVLDGHDVVDLTSTIRRDRVTGVRLVNRDGGAETTLSAELVVDATGRGSRAPVFLEKLGYGRPREDEVVMRLAYASQMLRIPPGILREGFVAIMPEPGRPTTFALVGYENDTWILTLGSMLGDEPPTDRDEMISFAEEFAPAEAVAAVRAAVPMSGVASYRLPSNRWRRYDKMDSTPKGLLVFGDAICSFDPIYGQGMTVAGLEAIALRECLLGGDRDLPRRFFKSTARHIRVAWQTAAGSDLSLPEVQGRRSRSMRISNSYLNWVLAATEVDPIVAGRFFRVTGMMDPPSRLLAPSLVYRVAGANRRHRGDDGSLSTRPDSVSAGVR
jgi:2-polyprenyl-6-methoxyphenol hydroxylase-like FAD-dependent oxidoreductase